VVKAGAEREPLSEGLPDYAVWSACTASSEAASAGTIRRDVFSPVEFLKGPRYEFVICFALQVHNKRWRGCQSRNCQ
jgi:hypothetical protein